MPAAQIVDVVNFMPERVVVNAPLTDAAGALAAHPFFAGVEQRRFASPDHSTVDLCVRALGRLLERTGTRAEELDLIICSVMLTDQLAIGVGPAIQHRVGATRATVLGADTGCTSYLSALTTARAMIEAGIHRRVAVVTATNFVSRLPEFQQREASRPLGDGASATLLAPGRSSFVSRFERAFGEHYGIMRFQPEAVDGVSREYWESCSGPLAVWFSVEMLEQVKANALRLVPEAVLTAIRDGGLAPDDIALLITHQPNTYFINEWRARIGIAAPRVHDTLAKYGNLFMSSLPVTLADAIDHGKVGRGDHIAIGSFSHAGDIASSLVLRWA